MDFIRESPEGLDTLIGENGRITVMFCAFDGAPNIVRFHGTGRVVTRYDDEYPALGGIRKADGAGTGGGGAETGAAWGVVFPSGGPVPRHPTQLYEAFLEGILLFLVLWLLFWKTKARWQPGRLVGAFLLVYGLARFAVEFVREADAHLVGFAAETRDHVALPARGKEPLGHLLEHCIPHAMAASSSPFRARSRSSSRPSCSRSASMMP